jgi:polysaccharide export outer membrane protein
MAYLREDAGNKGVVRFTLLSLSVLALAGCASFPDDGPASNQIVKNAHAVGDKHYDLVRLDYRVVQAVAANPPAPLSTLVGSSSTARLGLIEDGDLLEVSIFQPNSDLPMSMSDTNAFQGAKGPSSSTLPGQLVDDAGRIALPYAGQVEVAGLTPGEAALAIKQALRGRLINPQVLVRVENSPANSVTVLGEVKTSGLVRLSPNNDTLINIIAVAGGTLRPTGDVVVAITRAGRTTTAPLSMVLNDPAQNIHLAPRDQVRLIYEPRKFSTFGALTKDMQTPIEDDSLSLAGALSKLGGLDSNNANPGEVMLFRFERPEVARALGLAFDPNAARVPVVYKLNLREPSGFFVAQKFEIEPDDVIYVPHADFAEARKFFELVTEISNVGYDVALSTLIK